MIGEALGMIRELLELRKLLPNPKLPPAALRALQERKLRAVLRYAYDNVPYYHSLFNSAGLAPEDIRTLEDLQYIPVTTKEALRAAGVASITAKGTDLSSCYLLYTSGSTGKPFTVYVTESEATTRRLLEFRTLLSIGFRYQDRLAFLGPERQRPLRLHHRFGLYCAEVVPSLLSIDEQIRRLQKIRPSILWAYPTVLRALLHNVDYRLSKIVRPRVLITSAEICDEVMKERLRTDLNVEMFNFSAAREAGRIAAECPTHRGLHVIADHVLLECLDGDGSASGGKSGVVVLTNLDAFAMPFIRYRLGDLCTLLTERCPCDSPFPLITSPEGRDRDMLRLPSGKLLSPIGFHFILRTFSGIAQFRLIQESLNLIVLQLVTRQPLPPPVLSRLRSQFLRYLQEPIQIDIQQVDFLREDMPKFKTFISELPAAELW